MAQRTNLLCPTLTITSPTHTHTLWAFLSLLGWGEVVGKQSQRNRQSPKGTHRGHLDVPEEIMAQDFER